jgi:hypothetical protein
MPPRNFRIEFIPTGIVWSLCNASVIVGFNYSNGGYMAEQHTITFQYLKPGEDQPRAGYEITDMDFLVPPGGAVPRVGEFVQLITLTSSDTFEVVSVVTRIMSFEGQTPGWTSVVTVGPVKPSREALSIVRE